MEEITRQNKTTRQAGDRAKAQVNLATAAKADHKAEMEHLQDMVDELEKLLKGCEYQPSLDFAEPVAAGGDSDPEESGDYIPSSGRFYNTRLDEFAPCSQGRPEDWEEADVVVVGYFNEPLSDVNGNIVAGYSQDDEELIISGNYRVQVVPVRCGDKKWRTRMQVSGPKTFPVQRDRLAMTTDKGYPTPLDASRWALTGILGMIQDALENQGKTPHKTVEKFVTRIQETVDEITTLQEEDEEENEDSDLDSDGESE